ncbi:MAG: hypothetical protein LBN95_13500 [Prevotellaceae bacterium]|jgi:hypothetical protein|nr:hypothetical protein [Prevotellaceae bacterium]
MKKSYLYYLIPTILFFAACKTPNNPKEDPCKDVKTEAEAAQTMFNNQMTDVRGTRIYAAISDGAVNGYLSSCDGDTLGAGILLGMNLMNSGKDFQTETDMFIDAKNTRDITLPTVKQQVIDCQAQNPGY